MKTKEPIKEILRSGLFQPDHMTDMAWEKYLTELADRINNVDSSTEQPEGELERMKSAWPPQDIVSKLVEAVDILLHENDYDGHGWEAIEYCWRMAKEWTESIQQPPKESGERQLCINQPRPCVYRRSLRS